MIAHAVKGRGVFVAVVGPIGAGKTSIMRLAADTLANDSAVCFVRRVTTCNDNADEVHDTLSAADFLAAEAAGAFAVSWQANGLHYGIPNAVRDDIAAGRVVVTNASRDKSQEIKLLFQRSIVIHITATVDTLRTRLMARGREDAETVDMRLARSMMLEQGVTADIRIENNGALESATKQFIHSIVALKPSTAADGTRQANTPAVRRA
jgi:ribose 1,5-bisphosphokinase